MLQHEHDNGDVRRSADADPCAGIAAAPSQSLAARCRQRSPVRLDTHDCTEHLHDAVAVERALAGEHLEQHASERPDVAALVRRSPRACSGRMYAAVPRIIAAPVVIAGDVIVGDIDSARADMVAATGSIAFASPKSSTFTVPSGRTLMFAGFRSRWMIPCSCAASSASAICFAIGSASSSGIGAARDAIGESSALRPVPSRGP